MAKLNLANGQGEWIGKEDVKNHANEIIKLWDVIVMTMDDDTREAVHFDFDFCGTEDEGKLQFLANYLDVADADILIG